MALASGFSVRKGSQKIGRGCAEGLGRPYDGIFALVSQILTLAGLVLHTDLNHLAFLCVGKRTDGSEHAANVPGKVGASHDFKLSTGSSFPAPPEQRANRRRGSGVRAANSAVSDFDGGRTAGGL